MFPRPVAHAQRHSIRRYPIAFGSETTGCPALALRDTSPAVINTSVVNGEYQSLVPTQRMSKLIFRWCPSARLAPVADVERMVDHVDRVLAGSQDGYQRR